MSKILGRPIEDIKPGKGKAGGDVVEFRDVHGTRQRVECDPGWANAAISRTTSMSVPIDVSKLPKKRKRGKRK